MDGSVDGALTRIIISAASYAPELNPHNLLERL